MRCTVYNIGTTLHRSYPPPPPFTPTPTCYCFRIHGLIKKFHALEKGKLINAYNISMVIKLEYLHWSEHCVVNSPEAG